MVGALVEAEILERRRHPSRPLGRRDAGQHHRQRDVLGGGQPRHQVKALEDETDARAPHLRLLVGAQRRHVAAFQPVVADVGAVEQAEQVEQRRFAGTGRAHHGDVLAGVDGQVDAGQRLDRGVAELEAALDAGEFDQRHLFRRAVGDRLDPGLDAGPLERGDDLFAFLQAVEHLGVFPVRQAGLHRPRFECAVLQHQHLAALL
ncbi:hypothetical protein SDC9_169922 [bioreactor metagenome]|uniref:Uncharacterized protein n=1 Tax=bioreactor metagenome TaxID=1076179 RepID=A0A645G9Q9_9ZZZZ